MMSISINLDRRLKAVAETFARSVTENLKNRETERKIDREKDRQIEKKTERKKERQINRQTDKLIMPTVYVVLFKIV